MLRALISKVPNWVVPFIVIGSLLIVGLSVWHLIDRLSRFENGQVIVIFGPAPDQKAK